MLNLLRDARRCVLPFVAALLLPVAAQAAQLDIVGPPGSGGFGTRLTLLPNGNFVVTDPGFDAPGPISNVGAVYLYGPGGILISTLTGSTANDAVGSSGVTVLSNGNYVVRSFNWNGNRGAATWGNANSGVSGVVGASNSLIGSTTNDLVGASVTALSNGNYVVMSYAWDAPGIPDVGAVTWCDGSVGRVGTLSVSNSLIGGSSGDNVGLSGISALNSGNYLVRSITWDGPGGVLDVGAVTWGNGAVGTVGQVSAANSLVGSQFGDAIGSGAVNLLGNGNYLISSPNWDNGGISNAGAVTWGSGSTGVSGVVSASNSLVGGSVDDGVGSAFISPLSNGRYVVRIPTWDNGAAVDAGAASWGSGSSPVVGLVSASNALVGSSTNDQVGFGVTALNNGNYLVQNLFWNNGAIVDAGAVTWGNGNSGVSGAVSASNSLVGGSTFDLVGEGELEVLSNGNYVVSSPRWDNGAVVDAGAVTWGNGSSGRTGLVSASNSLVGGTTEDWVGLGGSTPLSNGHYVVGSSNWDNGGVANVGAATWGNGNSGVTGLISSGNSLIGTTANDQVGSSAIALSNGHYVVRSAAWNGSRGAASWGNGNGGTAGTVSVFNSLIGSNAGDMVGLNAVAALSSGHYVVVSLEWNGARGAVTWGNGNSGISGLVSASNSLVGSSSLDRVGQGFTALSGGQYVVRSPAWDNGGLADAGAMTWAPATGLSGPVSISNSLIGGLAGDQVGNNAPTTLSNGHFVLRSTLWNGSRGAATWVNGLSGISGVVSASNSLLGSTADDQLGSTGIITLSGGQYSVRSPLWDNGGAVNAGAFSVSPASGLSGTVDAGNSVRGLAANGGNQFSSVYDAQRLQVVVGRPADNIVSIFGGRATQTTISSDLPDPSLPFAPFAVRVAVRPVPPETANPSGSVTVRDGPADDVLTASCTMMLTGSAAEVGECTLRSKRAGVRTLTAEFSSSEGFAPSSDTEIHTVREFAIVKTRPNAAQTGQAVSVAVNLDLLPLNGSPSPTGTITVSDGTDSCVTNLPAVECAWSSATAGLKQLQASYSGDGNYPAMVSAKVPLQVGPDRFPELISVGQVISAQGDSASNSSRNALSADGRFLVFDSFSSNLVPRDTNTNRDIFRRDLQTGTTLRISESYDGSQIIGAIDSASISADGRYVVFRSEASNLVAADSNNASDVFIRDVLAGTTSRISVDSAGVQGNATSASPAMSADGRYVVFLSSASNLVVGDSNGKQDIFVRDLQAGSTTRVSVSSNGTEANQGSGHPAISADGRFVAFNSGASNLVPGNTNVLDLDVFVRDMTTGTLVRASVDSNGVDSDAYSERPMLSADGRFISFTSAATNLVAGDSNNFPDVFLRDLRTGTTTRVSLSSAGVQGNQGSGDSWVGADGRYVFFASNASNLVGSDSNLLTDLFRRDTSTNTTVRVSLGNSGNQGNGAASNFAIDSMARYVLFTATSTNLIGADTNGQSDVFLRDLIGSTTVRVSSDSSGGQTDNVSLVPAISADGGFVAFRSFASTLVSADNNQNADIFVRDRTAGVTRRVSVSSAGVEANGRSDLPAISADGRYVAFSSAASNLVLADSNAVGDIFVRDTVANLTSRVSVSSAGVQTTSQSYEPAISADGRYVAFASTAPELVAGDTNNRGDIFVRDTQLNTTVRVSVNDSGVQSAIGTSSVPSISATGRFIVFQSSAADLVAGDSNGEVDVFVHDLQSDTTIRASVDSSELQATGFSDNAAISADGRFVAFRSAASNLVSGDNNGQWDIFVRDLINGVTTRVSVDTGGAEANASSIYPALSHDGRYVSFVSQATNLAGGDTDLVSDVFVRDTLAGTTLRISSGPADAKANANCSATNFAISDTGLVAFSSFASNLAAGDDQGVGDIFVNRIPGFAAGNSTTTGITADSPDPSIVNTGFNVSVAVTRASGLANITGSVQISDGAESCTATLSGSGPTATGSCNLVSTSAGSKSLRASYSGDANYAPSVSAIEPHTVTATTLSGFTTTGDSPDPSRLERTVTFSWSLTPTPIAPLAPGRAPVTPTGTVTVKEAASCAAAPLVAQHQCAATLPSSSCQIAFVSTGVKNTVLCYSGDAAFAPAAAAESHEVVAASVPVSLGFVSSRRLGSEQIEVRFSTAANVGTVAFDVALPGAGVRASRSSAGEPLSAVSDLLASGGDSIRAADYLLTARVGTESFYLRGFDADGSVQSFGPFTVGSSSGASPVADAQAYDWTTRRSTLQGAESIRQSATLRGAAAERGVYLRVSQAGLQRISHEQLVAAGFNALSGIPVAELALTSVYPGPGGNAVRAIPVHINSADSLFNSGDTLSFVGDPADTQHSGERFYTLKRDVANARRVSEVSSASPGTQETLRQLPQTRIMAERKLFAPTSPGATPWTWIRLAATTAAVEQSLGLDLPNVTGSAAMLRVQLQGQVDHDGDALDHHVQLRLNGSVLGSMRFDGVRVFAQEFTVPAGLLRTGANTLTLRLPADTGLPSDVVALESLTLATEERLQAQAGRLDVQLSLPGSRGETADAPIFASGFEALTSDCNGGTCVQLALGGLQADAELYRISGDTVTRITGASVQSGELRLRLPGSAGDRLLAANPQALFSPTIGAIADSSTLLTGSAQYLVITHPAFAGALGPLLGARSAQGLTGKLVSTEQVYAAFSGGQPSPEALAAYLKVARTQLGTGYVLLVGGDTLDARGFQGSGSISFVPTLYRQTSPLIRFAPSDPALADTDGDGLQDLAIGRFPVRDSVELDRVLAKTLRPNPSRRALLVADRSEPGLDFGAISQALSALLPGYQVRQASRDQLSADALRQAIVEETNNGTGLIQYFGHASPARWGFDSVLSAAQIGSGLFNNSSQPAAVLQWACWTNYFIDPTHNTLGHAWLNGPAGASLVIGPSTLTETAHDEALAARLLVILNSHPSKALGQALLEAKRQLALEQPGQVDVQLGVSLLGDPAGR